MAAPCILQPPISSEYYSRFQTIPFRNEKDIILEFVDGTGVKAGYANYHNKSYDIKGIFDTQKDVVLEMLWKAKAYNPTRIKELSELLRVDESLIKRMIVGNYINHDEIHKRPLAKFTQDIAKQLKLI